MTDETTQEAPPADLELMPRVWTAVYWGVGFDADSSGTRFSVESYDDREDALEHAPFYRDGFLVSQVRAHRRWVRADQEIPDPAADDALADLRARVDRALQDSMDRCSRCKACDVQVDAVMAAIAAVAGGQQ